MPTSFGGRRIFTSWGVTLFYPTGAEQDEYGVVPRWFATPVRSLRTAAGWRLHSKARHPGHLSLISRLWPESTMQLVPCRLAGAPVAACGALLGTLKLNSPVS